MTQAIIECVPNFSEGRDNEIIKKIANSIRQVADVKLLHIDIGFDANRTVMTFAGSPEQVIEAAFQSIKTAAELIDMSVQKGAHPRIGATDVCPLIPVSGITMQEVVELSYQLAKRVGDELSIPVYCYEESAQQPERKNLAHCRSGEYEGLEKKLNTPEWKPDFGLSNFNAKSGATVIGARNFLIAYNINLNTKSVEIAKEIAARVRESGKTINGVHTPGLFQHLKAIGWYMDEYQKAQVSLNFTNFHETPIHKVFEAIQAEAKTLGAKVTGSELIGLIPLQALTESGLYFLENSNKMIHNEDDYLIRAAVKALGLEDLAPFEAEEKILEYRLAD